jgi:predicted PurR-regulated permease PerM
MTRAARFSYFFILLVLVLTGVFHLGTPLLTILFSYFALSKLEFTRHKWLPVLLFLVMVSGVLYGFGYLIRLAWEALPTIVNESIPKMVNYAKSQNIELPFDDIESLKAAIMEIVRDEIKQVGNFARAATKQFLFIVIGVVVSVSIFLNPDVKKALGTSTQRNLFTTFADEIVARFRCFYGCFRTVIGAQIVISGINTLLTAIFVVAMSLKHATVIIGLTFLCGLLPIVGNLISNCIIVGIAFTHSPRHAVAALVFLIVLHKLEYFLNSKIIGDRIKNPVWLTLLALIVGERLMGIPGMILAPVILNYIKVEASKIPAEPARNQ